MDDWYDSLSERLRRLEPLHQVWQSKAPYNIPGLRKYRNSSQQNRLALDWHPHKREWLDPLIRAVLETWAQPELIECGVDESVVRHTAWRVNTESAEAHHKRWVRTSECPAMPR